MSNLVTPFGFRGCVRHDFYGFPVRALSPAFIKIRNRTVYALLVELVFCIISLPLGAVRGGITKVSTGVNVTLGAVAVFGILATVKMDYIYLMAHPALVFGMTGIFVLYIFFSIAFGAGNADEGNWIVVLVFAFVIVDLVVACMSSCCCWAIYQERKRLRGLSAADIAAAARGGGSVATATAAPVVGLTSTSARHTATRTDNNKSVSVPVGAPAPVAVPVAAPAAAAAPAAGTASGDSAQECVVCMENPRNALIYRCGHIAVCFDCGKRLQERGRTCPICRGPITDVVRTFG